jgi:hypothetical protein
VGLVTAAALVLDVAEVLLADPASRRPATSTPSASVGSWGAVLAVQVLGRELVRDVTADLGPAGTVARRTDRGGGVPGPAQSAPLGARPRRR